MTLFRPVATGLALTLTFSSWSYASQTGAAQGTQTPPPTTGAAQAKPPAKDPAEQKLTRKEEIVVSASKTEQQLVDAPATMTVIGERALTVAPSNNYAELLRAVPGVNITQISARDVNVNSRGATSSLATSQLTVVDGRSVYLDFFGFTMWEFVPTDLDEIKRIEVIRGPASAVWGANALNGVVNFITKTPREMAGQSVTFGVGTFEKSINHNGADNGTMFYARGTHAQAVNDRWSYKISAGLYDSDALARPTGLVPNGGTTEYPAFVNTGTRQPRFDARVDYDFVGGDKLEMSAGAGGTDGMMHTGIGPFRIERGARMIYWKTTYTKKAFRLQAFMNSLEGEATNVVAVTPAGQPLGLTFAPKTFDVEVGDTRLLGGRHALTYGGNIRANRFELSIAPGENSRNEGGAYIQDEFMVSDMFRIVAGARVDKFSSIDHAVFSPRLALVMKPTADQSVRISYNRAFRAPSMVNNNLDTTIATPLPLGLVNPAFGNAVFLVPTTAVGNPDLKEESVDAYEVAYTGYLGDRTLLSAAVFYTKYKDGIYFTQTAEWLTAPPGFPGLGPFTPNQVWGGLLLAGIRFPSNYTYNNLGTVESKGIELGIDRVFNEIFSGFANYSFQVEPIPAFPGLSAADALKEINLPSQHQFNAGVTFTNDRIYGTFSVSYASEAFWQDVLDSRFHGTTPGFTSVNVTMGVKFQGGRYALAVKAVNLGNQHIQQHIFGDVMKRQIGVEFKVALR
jgi:iron complex outermembrane receptor protein